MPTSKIQVIIDGSLCEHKTDENPVIEIIIDETTTIGDIIPKIQQIGNITQTDCKFGVSALQSPNHPLSHTYIPLKLPYVQNHYFLHFDNKKINKKQTKNSMNIFSIERYLI